VLVLRYTYAPSIGRATHGAGLMMVLASCESELPAVRLPHRLAATSGRAPSHAVRVDAVELPGDAGGPWRGDRLRVGLSPLVAISRIHPVALHIAVPPSGTMLPAGQAKVDRCGERDIYANLWV
jgi:hypothetical protein